MKKEVLIILSLVIFLFGILIVSSQNNDDKIDSQVRGLEGNDSIKVVIDIKEPTKEEGIIFKTLKTSEEILREKQEVKDGIISQVGEEDVRHVFDDRVAVEINQSDLEILKSNPNIENIRIDVPMIAFLTDSVPIVNATRTWPIQLSGINITGIDETICIVDTGVNFSHPDLIGKNLSCNIDCVSKSCRENCSITDDNGHGTHVAGIAGANGSLKGVAIGAKIIGVKVLNSVGSGSTSDVEAGINWCIANANTYNISVISMSLGTACKYSNGTSTGWCFSTYCDNDIDTQSTAVIIDNATSRNISVVIAAGNSANYTHISSPACIQNATAIGATDKNDNIDTSYSNRNNITDLFATGTSINSSMIPNPAGTTLSSCGTGKSYCLLSGTSMSTPHAAGAFALVRQYFRLQNGRVPTPIEIQNILNSTGKSIPDSQSGLSFSRINIYGAILSIDTSSPIVNLISPANNSINTTINQTFSCNSTDLQLANVTFYLWNSSSSIIYNESKSLSGAFNLSIFNVTNLSYVSYKWNCKTFDTKNNSAFATNNFTITITNLAVNLSSPENNLATKLNQSYICNFNSQESKALKNSTVYIWNSSGALMYNLSENISGIINSSVYNYNFSGEGNYSWNCKIFNNNTESVFADSNFSIRYDITPPSITSIISTSLTSTTSIISWDSNENTNSTINYGTNMINLNLNSSNSSFVLNHSIVLSGLASSTVYYYNLSYCDNAGNCITNGTNSFTTSAAEVVSSGSGGGGGGGGGSNALSYTVKSEEFSAGYTQTLNKNEKIIFSIPEEKTQASSASSGGTGHSLVVNEVKDNYANITVRSKPLNIILFVGESKKLNLSSPDYYDLYIRLNEIINKKAKITVKSIHENLIGSNLIQNNSFENPLNDTEKSTDIGESENSVSDINWMIIEITISIIILVFIIVIVFLRKNGKKPKGNKKQKVIKEYKELFDNHIKPKN